MTPIPQEELDAYYRSSFVMPIINEIFRVRNHEIKFLAVKNHHSLVTVKQVHNGEFEFGIADRQYYSYKMADVVTFLEDLYDKNVTIIALKGEFKVECIHMTATTQAEIDAAA
jgi:hypothetical protein